MSIPFELRVYDKNYAFKGKIGSALVESHPIWGEVGYTRITIPADHWLAGDVMTPGARMVIYHRDEFLMSGKIRERTIDNLVKNTTITVTVRDDIEIFKHTLGFPNPGYTPGAGGAVTGQVPAFRVRYTYAESVVKQAINEDMARLGRTDVTTAPNLFRGARGKYLFRFKPLWDELYPKIEQAGIGITVRQEGTGLVVDVREPRVFGTVLSVANGTVVGGSGTLTDPTVTRAVVGGPGEGETRQFEVHDSPTREAQYGEIMEVFTEARTDSNTDIDPEDLLEGETPVEPFQGAADEVINAGAPTSGFRLELAETEWFQYGTNGVLVGDVVTVEVGGQHFVDTLREAKLTWDVEKGAVAVPMVGDRANDASGILARKLRALFTGDRERKVR